MSNQAMRIGDVAQVVRGVTYKKPQALTERAPGHVPLLRATNIGRRLDFLNLVYVPESVVKQEQRLQAGDIVLAASSGSLGVVGKAAELKADWEGTFGAFCYVVRPDKTQVRSRYLELFMQSPRYRKRVSQLAAGTNINNLKRDHIESFELPRIGLEEQDAVIAAIDKQFTRLDAAGALLDKVQLESRWFRASLLEGIVHEAFRLASSSMRQVPLVETWKSAGYGTSVKCSYENQGAPVLRIPNIRWGQLDLKDIKRADEGADLAKLMLKGNDLLVIRTNGSKSLIGRTAAVTSDLDMAFASYLIRLGLDRDVVTAPFVSALLEAPSYRREMQHLAGSTSGQYNVSLSKLRTLKIPVPDLESQHKLVSALQEQFSVGDNVEAQLQRASLKGEVLRGRILKKSFLDESIPAGVDA